MLSACDATGPICQTCSAASPHCRELDALIAAGWGDIPRGRIPPNWRTRKKALRARYPCPSQQKAPVNRRARK
jgi:hypothetical protein